MPRHARRPGRRPRRHHKKQGVPRSLNPMNQHAEIIETVDFGQQTANGLFGATFTLAQFPRAQMVATAYKWYKPVECVWEYTPLYNTYQDAPTGATASATSVPTFFSIMNRTQDSRSVAGAINGLDYIESMGAKPRMFTKKITLSYKPNWCSPGLATYQLQNQQASSPPFPVVTGFSQAGLKAEFAWLQGPNRVDKSITTQVSPGTSPDAQASLPISGLADGTFIGGNPDFPSNYFNPQMATTLTNLVVFNGHEVYIRQDSVGLSDVIADVRLIVKWAFKHPNAVQRQFGDRATDVSGAQIL
nr:MAG: capsid protein [Cressdnaviricota sp.]